MSCLWSFEEENPITKYRITTTGTEIKTFLRSALQHSRRNFFFGQSRAELCGFRNEGEIYETIPIALKGSRLSNMNEDDHEHEYVPHVAIARVLAALARSEGFASRYRVLKKMRFAQTLCSPSPKRAIIQSLAELLNSVRNGAIISLVITRTRISRKHNAHTHKSSSRYEK